MSTEESGHLAGCAALEYGKACDCAEPDTEQPLIREVRAHVVEPDEATHRLDDTGEYYCVLATTHSLVTRYGRPCTATLAEWLELARPLPALFYIPVGAHPLIMALPLVQDGKVPDIVGRVVELVSFLEKGATTLAQRVDTVDTQLAGRVHERELLRRAAALLDSDAPSYEQRLDWLAKYREVIAR